MSALSRRSIVASAAALPALAVPAVVSAAIEPDPIYAVIERDRLLEAAFQARCAYEDELEGIAKAKQPASIGATRPPFPRR
jgi:hypothetical protein